MPGPGSRPDNAHGYSVLFYLLRRIHWTLLTTPPQGALQVTQDAADADDERRAYIFIIPVAYEVNVHVQASEVSSCGGTKGAELHDFNYDSWNHDRLWYFITYLASTRHFLIWINNVYNL